MSDSNPAAQAPEVLATRHWLETFVVELNLCPFARPVIEQNRVRFFLSQAKEEEALYQEFLKELLYLHEANPEEVETTLIIAPLILEDFESYLDFLAMANESLEASGLEGTIQIASFHPDYQFAGEDPDSVTHYTNRSPYPMLHLLREASVSQAVDRHPDPDGIPDRNMELLESMGLEKVREMIGP